MTAHAQIALSNAAHGHFLTSRLVLGAAAGLAAVVLAVELLSAMPRAGVADVFVAPQTLTWPTAHAVGAARGDPSVPDASTVLAGRNLVIEEQVQPF